MESRYFYNLYSLLILLLLLMSCSVLAGGIEYKPRSTKFYIGAGVSYATDQVRSQIDTTRTDLPSGVSLVNEALFNIRDTHFSPIGYLGFWMPIGNSTKYFGIRGFYRFSGLAISSGRNGSIWAGFPSELGYSSYLTHEVLVGLGLASHLNDLLFFINLGPTFFTLKNKTVFSEQGSVFRQRSSRKELMGGGFEVGISYFFLSDYTIDISYVFMASSKRNFSPIRVQTSSTGVDEIRFRSQVFSQGLFLSIGRMF